MPAFIELERVTLLPRKQTKLLPCTSGFDTLTLPYLLYHSSENIPFLKFASSLAIIDVASIATFHIFVESSEGLELATAWGRCVCVGGLMTTCALANFQHPPEPSWGNGALKTKRKVQ